MWEVAMAKWTKIEWTKILKVAATILIAVDKIARVLKGKPLIL